MDEGAFQVLADATLKELMARLDEALAEAADVDLSDGILTLELDSGAKYVINKQAANRQIWVASPVSGGWHFEHAGGGNGAAQWRSTRDATTLAGLLEAELGRTAGSELRLG
jgi:frataxin